MLSSAPTILLGKDLRGSSRAPERCSDSKAVLQQSATRGVWLGGCREGSITWACCVNSGQMEKLAVWLINVVDIKQLRVGGFAWWGGAEQDLGSIQLILSGLNPGC